MIIEPAIDLKDGKVVRLLKGDFDTIEARLKARKGHFFKPQMLVTQFATLEEPGSDEPDVLVVDIAHSLDDVVAATVATIQDAISQD